LSKAERHDRVGAALLGLVDSSGPSPRAALQQQLGHLGISPPPIERNPAVKPAPMLRARTVHAEDLAEDGHDLVPEMSLEVTTSTPPRVAG